VARGKGLRFDYKLVERLASIGLVDSEIEAALDIPKNTFEKYKRRDARLARCLAVGAQAPHREVVRSLYRLCLGYNWVQQKVKIVETKTGGSVRLPMEETLMHIPPNVKAIETFLCNRFPNEWKKRSHIDVTGELTLKDRMQLSGIGVGQDEDEE